ncbi:MAG: hypothetical protein VW080_07100 [Flavobacteriaceae bacterium]
MKLLQRLGYYLGGFSVGLIFLAFILNGKKTSCNYSPSARVKSNLSLKEVVIPKEIQNQYPQLTESLIQDYIKKGSINFSKSDTQKDSCRLYHIEIESVKEAFLEISNCKKTAILLRIETP